MTTVAMPPELAQRLSHLRHIVLDMDGTIYLGNRLFPWTRPFLKLLRESGLSYTFITNNCSRSGKQYEAKLARMGLPVARHSVFTSAHGTMEFLRSQRPDVRRVFVVGTVSLKAELCAAGFSVVGLAVEDEPDAVIVGFDTSLKYASLCRAAWWLQQGKTYLATHVDRVCPTDEPIVLPDCGSICACLEHATGRKPEAVLGKPSPRMVEAVLERHGLSAAQLAVVGDRLYTDIAMAQAAGALGVLVLTGESSADDARYAPQPPDLVVPDLEEFGRLLKQAHQLFHM